MNNFSNNNCTIYLVRHGETDWNVKKIIQGHKQSILNKNGKDQAKKLAKHFQNIHIDAIFSSDLLRAKQTAEIVALEKKLAVTTSHLLRERSYGQHEGKLRDHYYNEVKDLLETFKKLSKKEKWNFKITEDMESEENITK